MDIFQTSRYFDSTQFQEWDFNTSSWVNSSFVGQLKKADNFVSIWNRPTRKRMLYSQVNVPLNSSVVRVTATGEIFLVGSSQDDAHLNTGYRRVFNAHEAYGVARVLRKLPQVKAGGELGFALSQQVEVTFGDYELRATDRLSDDRILGYGEYFLFLPSNSNVQDLDTVEIAGKEFYVYEVYKDSGLVTCRATGKSDDRVNLQYIEKLTAVYDPNTQSVNNTEKIYETTAKLIPKIEKTDFSANSLEKGIRVVMRKDFISYTPKIGNFIQFSSQRYRIDKIALDSLHEEYVIDAVL